MTACPEENLTRAGLDEHADALGFYQISHPEPGTVHFSIDISNGVRGPEHDPATWRAIADMACARLYGYNHLEPADPTRIMCTRILTGPRVQREATAEWFADVDPAHAADRAGHTDILSLGGLDPHTIDWGTVRHHVARAATITRMGTVHAARELGTHARRAVATYAMTVNAPDTIDDIRKTADEARRHLHELKDTIDRVVRAIDATATPPRPAEPMPAHLALAHAIAHTTATPGVPDRDPDTNPLWAAYGRYPGVRRIIDASPHNTEQDVINHRVTADVTEDVIAWLRSRRHSRSV